GGEPPGWPSGGAGAAGGAAGAGAGAGVGAGVRVLATVGSSLSLGRGNPGARGGRPWSGRLGGRSRAGRSRAGRSREASRRGRSVGTGRGGGSSAARGDISGRPCGAPTAATVGTRLTITGFD